MPVRYVIGTSARSTSATMASKKPRRGAQNASRLVPRPIVISAMVVPPLTRAYRLRPFIQP